MAIIDSVKRKRRQMLIRQQRESQELIDAEDDDYYNDSLDVEDDNSRWELETNELLERFEHSLRCEKQDPNTKQWYRPKGTKPKLNDSGIYDTISDLRSVMHKGTYLGNIDFNYAIDQTKAEARAYKTKLKHNAQLWEVEKSQIKSLVLIYARQFFMALTRPIGDRERSHRDKRIKINESMKNDLDIKPEIKL